MAELTIKDWQLGIGESPYTGFAQMTNVDIYSKPGSVLISNKLVPDANSDEVVDELIIWMVQNPAQGDVYGVDREGTLYFRDNGTDNWSIITGHGSSGANGCGLAIWNDYLFYARNVKLDVYGPLSSSPSWENDWQDLESANSIHPILSGDDGHLYVGNGHFVSTVIQTLGDLVVNPGNDPFDPTDPVTYTWDDPRLTLNTYYDVSCLEQLGSNIAIGTTVGINKTVNIADVFIWDGASTSYFDGSTIHLVENGVVMMQNENNVLNIIAGNGVPRIFNAVTSQSIEVKRFNNIDVRFRTTLNLRADSTELKEGEVLFGIGQSASDDLSNMGVYALRNKAYVLRYLISTGRDGSTNGVLIGSVKSISANEILVAWNDQDNTPEFGVDILAENYYTGYTAFIDSPLYSVGTEDDPKTYEKVQVTMGKSLNDGDGVRIKARYALDGTWTTVATLDTTTTPAYIGRNTIDTKVSNLGKFKEVQFRVELTTDEDSEISPELKTVTFT